LSAALGTAAFAIELSFLLLSPYIWVIAIILVAIVLLTS